jgi:hypothetical protein
MGTTGAVGLPAERADDGGGDVERIVLASRCRPFSSLERPRSLERSRKRHCANLGTGRVRTPSERQCSVCPSELPVGTEITSSAPPSRAPITVAARDTAIVAHSGQPYVKRTGTRPPCGGRRARIATVTAGIRLKKATGKRAPRSCATVRRLATVGNETPHATPAPQDHPSRLARSNPDKSTTSGSER